MVKNRECPGVNKAGILGHYGDCNLWLLGFKKRGWGFAAIFVGLIVVVFKNAVLFDSLSN